jgi:hypothetical protein
MKKIITFLLCLNIVLSAVACTPGDRPNDIDKGSEPSISESEPDASEGGPDVDEPVTVKEYYKIEKLDDSSSRFYIYDKNGNVVLEDETDLPLKISMLGDNIVDIAIGERVVASHKYYDVGNNVFSEYYSYVVASSGSLVAYVDNIESADDPVLIVRDMFDNKAFFKSFSLNWAPGRKDYPVDSASFTENEGELSVIYWSERPAIRFYTVLPIRNESVDYEKKYLADYDSILKVYRTMVNSFDEVDVNFHAFITELFGPQSNMEVEWLYAIYSSGELLYPGRGKDNIHAPYYKQKCGYAIKDLNGDGVDELVLLNSDYTIVAIFSTVHGRPVLFGNYWERHKCYIDGEGLIHESGSSGADVGSHKIFRIAKDGATELIEEYGRDGHEWIDGEAVDKYYRIGHGEEKVYITKEEYDSLSAKYGKFTSKAYTRENSGLEFTPLFSEGIIAE